MASRAGDKGLSVLLSRAATPELAPTTPITGEEAFQRCERLAAPSRSASATLRLLVEEAGRDMDGRYRGRDAQEVCCWLMCDKAGDRPHFEDAIRARFAGEGSRFHQWMLSPQP